MSEKITVEELELKLKEIAQLESPLKIEQALKELELLTDFKLPILKSSLSQIKKSIEKKKKDVLKKKREEEKLQKKLDEEVAKKARQEFAKKKVQDLKKAAKNEMEKLKIEYFELAYGRVKQPEKATELLVNFIEKKEKIDTIRDDSNTEIWVYSDGIRVPHGKTFIKELLRDILGEFYKISVANEVLAKIEADTGINPEDFFIQESSEMIIPVQNGLLNLLTKKIEDFTPDKIFFSKLPIKYEPEAKCPQIEKFFSEITKDKEDVKVIKETFANFLIPDNRNEKAVMLLGSGRNAKGKTLRLMENFLGKENCVSIPLQHFDDDPYALGELLNKRANISGDLDKRAIKSSGHFKMITGRDRISAARKYRPRVTFLPMCKQVYACNTLPYSSDDTDGFMSKWVLLEFPFKFLSQKELDALSEEERKNCKLGDPNILDKISTPEELSGLLNLVLESLSDLLKNKDFSYSKVLEEVRQLWIRKSDSFRSFVLDCLEPSEEMILSDELSKEYAKYCKKFKIKTLGAKHIKDVLEEFGAVRDREQKIKGRPYVWSYISFKEIEGRKPLTQLTQLTYALSTFRELNSSDIDWKLHGSRGNLGYEDEIPINIKVEKVKND